MRVNPSRIPGRAFAGTMIAALVAAFAISARADGYKSIPTVTADELTVGETGYGLTVLQGDAITRFDVSYLGRVEKAMPGQDMILIRLEGEPFSKTGVIAGMSGSPIYFRNRLLGALAYGWGFSKEPIAGVTPIGLMFPLIDEQKLAIDLPPEARPVATPLSVAGLALERDAEAWRRIEELGFQAGVGGRVNAKASRLEPGSAVGVRLVDGDLSLTAVGTVTMVTESDVIAFGHPFINRGLSNLPMTGARVDAIMPVQSISFKMSSALNDVGAMLRDGQAGISGRLGPSPDMIPTVVRLRAPWTEREYRYLVARDELFTPQLFNIVWAASAGSGLFNRGPAGVEVSVAVRVDGRVVTLRDKGVVKKSVLEVMPTLPIQILYGNPFREVAPERVDISVEVTRDLRYHEILSARPTRRTVAPGETLDIDVEFQTYNSGRSTRRFSLPIPQRVRPGSMTVIVSGGRGFDVPGRAEPRSVEDILAQMGAYEPQDLIVLRGMPDASTDYEIDGGVLPSLPPGLRKLQEGFEQGLSGFEVKRPMDVPVIGAASVEVAIEDPRR